MSSTRPDPNEVMELEREALRLFKAGDIDGLMDSLIAQNGLACPPGADAIAGRENQRAVFKEIARTEGLELSWEPIEAHVSASNDMAYVYGSIRLKMPGAAEEQGKYVSIWVKENGKWMNAVEIRNANG